MPGGGFGDRSLSLSTIFHHGKEWAKGKWVNDNLSCKYWIHGRPMRMLGRDFGTPHPCHKVTWMDGKRVGSAAGCVVVKDEGMRCDDTTRLGMKVR